MKGNLYNTINDIRNLEVNAILKSVESLTIYNSELNYKNEIVKNLYSRNELLESGWYVPPSYGTGVLIVPVSQNKRLRYSSLRNEEYFAKEDIFSTKDSVIFFYTSAFDKNTGIIGDIGVTVYTGEDVKIQKHFVEVLRAMEEVVDSIEVGQLFKDIYPCAEEILKKHNLYFTHVVATTGVQMGNVGHTIPWSYEEMEDIEIDIFTSGNFESIKDMISQKRRFINSTETFEIQETCAFTIESKVESEDKTLPSVYFHFIVVFENGQKKICSNFNLLFRCFKMDYLVCKFG